MQHWDPIGVRDEPNAQDEYDAYIGKVYAMLMDEHASTDEIFEYLYGIATKRMGLRETAELLKCCRDAASVLARLHPEFEAH